MASLGSFPGFQAHRQKRRESCHGAVGRVQLYIDGDAPVSLANSSLTQDGMKFSLARLKALPAEAGIEGRTAAAKVHP